MRLSWGLRIPFQKDGVAAGMRNHRAGHVEVSRVRHGYGHSISRLLHNIALLGCMVFPVQTLGHLAGRGSMQPLLGLLIS